MTRQGERDGSRTSGTNRQMEVELNAVILAAEKTNRAGIVDKLRDLRGAWLGFARHEEEREARETALLREVDRVDRTAARLAVQTERLRRLRDEAMEAVRRVEPDLLDSPPSSSHRLGSQEDLLVLNRNLRDVQDMVVLDSLHEDDLKLTELLSKPGTLRRRGSVGSLLQRIDPPAPQVNNWGSAGYRQWPHPHQEFPQYHHPYQQNQSQYNPDQYQPKSQYQAHQYHHPGHHLRQHNQVDQYQNPVLTGNHYPTNGQYPQRGQHAPTSQYPHPGQYHIPGQYPNQGQYPNYGQYPPHPQQGHPEAQHISPDRPERGSEGRQERLERDMSTDEGENTSNDAGDISSSDASGSGRRRKRDAKNNTSPSHHVKNINSSRHQVKKVTSPSDQVKKVISPSHKMKKVVSPSHQLRRVPSPSQQVMRETHESQQGRRETSNSEEVRREEKKTFSATMKGEDKQSSSRDRNEEVSYTSPVREKDRETTHPTHKSEQKTNLEHDVQRKKKDPLLKPKVTADFKENSGLSNSESPPSCILAHALHNPDPDNKKETHAEVENIKATLKAQHSNNKTAEETTKLTTEVKVNQVKYTDKNKVGSEQVDMTKTHNSGVTEDSSESDTEVLLEEERRASVDRERKVGMGAAYTQMVMGVGRPAQLSLGDESTSDDVEAEFAAMARPKNTFRSTGGPSLHNMEDSLSECEMRPQGKPQVDRKKPGVSIGNRGLAGGGMGHPMPIGLVGGRLAHPAANKVGLVALHNTDSEAGAELSAAEEEEDEDFWS